MIKEEKLNILFVNPFKLRAELMDQEISIGLLYIENLIKSKIKNVKTDIIDMIKEVKLNNFNPDRVEPVDKFHDQMDKLINSIDFELDINSIVAITVPTSKHFIPTIMIAKYFQKNYPQIPIVLGGAHVSSVPQDFIFDKAPIDYIIIGEGELSFLDIIKAGFKKRKTPKKYLNNPIEQLDDLPVIDFSLYEKYLKEFTTLSISLSRGCPFNCSFCMEKKLIEGTGNIHKKWRSYTPKRAKIELESMLKFGEINNIRSYAFYDPIFGFSRQWLLKFLDLYPIEPDFHVWTECRLDVLNEDVLTKLAARKVSLMYGLETYSKKMLSIMNKTKNPSQYIEKFNEIMKISEKLEMFCVLNIIINHPGETRQSFKETFEFAKKISEKVDLVNLNYNLMRNFPGTPLYCNLDYYRETYGSEFYFLDWWRFKDQLDYGLTCIRSSKNLSLREILNLYRDSYIELQELNIKHLKESKNRLEDYFVKIMYEKSRITFLENLIKNMIEFLDVHEIEIESKHERES